MDDVEAIKRRIDIVDLISSYLTLKKAGSNYKALCPFHQEKTPSFMVSPEKQIWHCFGCSEGGDIYTFVMKMENLEFREALEMLAQRAGVTLQKRKSFDSAPQDRPDRKSRLFALNKLTARTFHKILISHPSGQAAREYLKKRQLTQTTIKEFMIGYAPSSRAMAGFLKKQGFSEEEMSKAGSPERFFRRIIFPISDIMGNVIAFTGRIIDPKQEPKYLNTPETIIFHKSRVLYNLVKARGEIKRQKAAVVVEGQMDVISSWQAGVRNVVATSGTALTSDHLQILLRYSPNIIFAFDADTAGLQTAKKAYEMAIEEGMNVKMVSLGEFKDPGEMIAQNPGLWQEAVAKASSVIDWYFNLAFGRRLTASSKELTSQEKKEIAKEILPIIHKIPDTIEQAHYIGLLAKRLSVPEGVVFDALKKVGLKTPVKPSPVPKAQKKISAAELLLGILLQRPDKIKIVEEKIKETDFLKPELKAIYKELAKLYNSNQSGLNSLNKRQIFQDKLKKTLNRQLQVQIDELLLLVEEQVGEEELEADLQGALKILKDNQREALKEYFAREIQKAENDKDRSRLKKLIKEFQDAISK